MTDLSLASPVTAQSFINALHNKDEERPGCTQTNKSTDLSMGHTHGGRLFGSCAVFQPVWRFVRLHSLFDSALQFDFADGRCTFALGHVHHNGLTTEQGTRTQTETRPKVSNTGHTLMRAVTRCRVACRLSDRLAGS
jgi:hypothetical protein